MTILRRVLLDPIERLMWVLARSMAEVRYVKAVELVDLRATVDDVSTDDVATSLTHALEEIENAGHHFVELVDENVSAVARMKLPSSRANARLRVYQSAFATRELQNPRLLAANLIWASKYFEISHRSMRDRNEGAMAVADSLQSWFVRQFPDWRSWIEDVRRTQLS